MLLFRSAECGFDGKQSRNSGDKSNGQGAINTVSAWAASNRLVLGQKKVEGKSNEITALPELIKILDLSGCIVTIDAIGCQREYEFADVREW